MSHMYPLQTAAHSSAACLQFQGGHGCLAVGGWVGEGGSGLGGGADCHWEQAPLR
jgi:hypothetical protein